MLMFILIILSLWRNRYSTVSISCSWSSVTDESLCIFISSKTAETRTKEVPQTNHQKESHWETRRPWILWLWTRRLQTSREDFNGNVCLVSKLHMGLCMRLLTGHICTWCTSSSVGWHYNSIYIPQSSVKDNMNHKFKYRRLNDQWSLRSFFLPILLCSDESRINTTHLTGQVVVRYA